MTSELVAMLDLEPHQERVSFYRGILFVENNLFESFAPTTEEAISFLIRGLVKHGEEYGLDVNWYKDYMPCIRVNWVAFGDCNRIQDI